MWLTFQENKKTMVISGLYENVNKLSNSQKIELLYDLQKIIPDSSSKSKDFMCQICTEKEIECSFEKCGHVLCNTCSTKVHNTCPFCKTHSVVKKLYFC